MKFLNDPLKWLSVCASISLSQFSLSAREQGQRIPDELESVGGNSLGFGNGGSAAVSDLGSVRANPGMLGTERTYSLTAGYHWPTSGRDFYQVGIVDAKTSPIAAGVSYTSSKEEYHPSDYYDQAKQKKHSYYDSAIKYRVAVGAAQQMGSVSFGIGGQYVEGFTSRAENDDPSFAYDAVKGATLSFGMAGLMTSTLRFGLSVENLANRKVKNLAPRAYRAGVAHTLFRGNVTVHGDLLQRDRVAQETLPTFDEVELDRNIDDLTKPERMAIGSFSVRIQNMLRLIGGIGQEIGGSGRKSLSGGIAVVNEGFSISYQMNQPYLTDSRSHQALNVTMQMAL